MNKLLTLVKINSDIEEKWEEATILNFESGLMLLVVNKNSKILMSTPNHPVSVIYTEDSKVKFYSTRILRIDAQEPKVVLNVDSMDEFIERRKHVRYPVYFVGKNKNISNENITILNASNKGIRIKSQIEHNCNESIDINATINDCSLNFKGIIITKLKTPSGYEYGVKLTKVSK